jgi:hypothetical protein
LNLLPAARDGGSTEFSRNSRLVTRMPSHWLCSASVILRLNQRFCTELSDIIMYRAIMLELRDDEFPGQFQPCIQSLNHSHANERMTANQCFIHISATENWYRAFLNSRSKSLQNMWIFWLRESVENRRAASFTENITYRDRFANRGQGEGPNADLLFPQRAFL